MFHIKPAITELLFPFRSYFSDKGSYAKWFVYFSMILIFIFIEYYFQITTSEFEIRIFITYSISLLLPIAVFIYFTKKYLLLRSIQLWFLIGSVVTSIYLFDTQRFYIFLIKEYCPVPYRYITYRILYQLIIWLYFLIPFIVWKITCSFYPYKSNHKDSTKSFHKINTSSYLIVVFPMLIVVFIASLFPDFRSFYPRAPLNDPLVGEPISWYLIILFEFAYILAFIATEWFFRRFLIQSFSTFFGKESIMIVTFLYVAVHFQKPVMETISSSLGGFALGILAYHTGQIRGGVIIHVSIAIAMEIMGFYWLRNA